MYLGIVAFVLSAIELNDWPKVMKWLLSERYVAGG